MPVVLSIENHKARKARRAMIEHARETLSITQDPEQALQFAVEAHRRASVAIAREVRGRELVMRDPEAAEEWSRLAADMLAFYQQETRAPGPVSV